jgi:quinoprotein glucose dehydrogenase
MKTITRRSVLYTGAAAAAFAGTAAKGAIAQAAAAAAQSSVPDTEWRVNGGDLTYSRYAPLDQINAQNFNQLRVAWRFRTASLGPSAENQLQATPLMIKGRLYLTAGSRRDVVCLDAATGELLWMYRMDEGQRGLNAPRRQSGRGVGYWTDGTKERIIFVTIGYRLVSLDAKTGLVDPEFGVNGVVDLKQDFDQDIDLETADVGLHSAPTIANGVVIIGAAHTAGNTPKTRYNVKGFVRGFDVRTGKRLWIFHTIPQKGEFGYETWAPGTAEKAGNTGAWAQISADEELGLAYVGVEMPTGDQMGFYVPGNNLFSESIVALDTRTGKRKWHYQMVHHGLWDYDVPAAAVLCDIPHEGKIVKALAQPTKQAWLFVLNRETGEPIWPIVEKPVPAGDVPGEYYSPTQPHPTKPPAYDVQGTSPDVLIDFTPELRAKALEIAKHYKFGPIYTAPVMGSMTGTWGVLNLPGYIGGSNWPGAAYDPETHMVYVYSQTNVLTPGVLVENTSPEASDFKYVHVSPGSPIGPGAGGGPDPDGAAGELRPGQLTVEGLPIVKPPYGRLSAINLERGDITWQVPCGETPDNVKNHPRLKGMNIPRTGQAGRGVPVVTKTLVIMGDPGAFTDETGRRGARLRAYDKATGGELGAVFIPSQQTGQPMTYMFGGRQYVVLAVAGYGGNGAELIAFSLPA